MSLSLGDFLAGLLTPLVISGLLTVGVRQLADRGPAGGGSLTLAAPLAVLVVSLIAAVFFWESRRSVSYGLIAAVALALAISGIWWASHTSAGVPPPR
jgi:hypothetical protein